MRLLMEKLHLVVAQLIRPYKDSESLGLGLFMMSQAKPNIVKPKPIYLKDLILKPECKLQPKFSLSGKCFGPKLRPSCSRNHNRKSDLRAHKMETHPKMGQVSVNPCCRGP